MKTKLKRVLSLLLAGTMCLSLVACGDKEDPESTKTLADELGYGYVSSFQDLNSEIDWVNSVSSAQGKLYYSGDYYDESTQTNSTRLYEMDPGTGETKMIPVPEMENTEGVNEYIQQLTVCADGSGYWMVCERYVYSQMDVDYGTMPLEEAEPVPAETEAGDQLLEPEEAPAEGEADTTEADAGLSADYQVELLSATAVAVPTVEAPVDEAAEEILDDASVVDDGAEIDEGFVDEYVEPDISNYAKKVDMSGNIIQEINLNDATEALDYFYPNAIAQNGAGDLFIATDNTILCFGADGTQKESVVLENGWVQSMATTGNGAVLVSYYSYNDENGGGNKLSQIDNGVLSEPLVFENLNTIDSLSISSGAGDTILATDGDYLYTLDVKTGAATKLLSWLDADVNGTSINGIAAADEDTILVLMADYGDTISFELGTLTKTPASELPERTVLTIGAVYLNDVLRKAVINFNRSNDTYRVTMVDYGAYNTDDDYNLGANQLDRDIVSGNCPDIISMNSGYEKRYISKGALADLSALIEKDESFSMDELVVSALKQFIVEDKLYAIATGFSVETMGASTKLVGDRESWTMQDLGEIIKNLDADVEVMSYTSQESFVTQMVQQNMDMFVDYGKATCSFDSPEFKELLQVASYLPTQEEIDAKNEDDSLAMENGVYNWTDPNQQLQSGELLMNGLYLSGSYSVKELFSLYTKENGISLVGYPQNSGNGVRLSVDNAIAISAKCKHQEGAWEFLKSLTNEKNQENVWSYPISAKKFDTFLEECMERSFYMENDEKVYYDDYTYIGDTNIPLKPLTQEQVDAFKEMINGASVGGTYDEEIYNILTEEVGAYFSGDKSADDVAALIQNRVTIYLGENS